MASSLHIQAHLWMTVHGLESFSEDFQVLFYRRRSFISDADSGDHQDPNPGHLALGLKSGDIVKNK